ncbi:subtilisin-like protease [Phtheirospermum japonicum]|uniref:Subtilisin-like protease n=1 Tax=Phtheirospermum japonicum TaxID=374723 RepID=A0A830CUL4_9LAMI|nr:subtilisin-like protease [Phtheirospermum japonicum]
MENFHLSIFLSLLFLPVLVVSSEKQVYIVYLGEHSGQKTVQEIEESHHSHLLSVKETEEDAKSSLVYSYKHSINGFSAFLTPHEASKLSGADGGSGVCVSELSTEILFANDEIVAIYGFFRGSKFQQLGDGKFMVEIGNTARMLLSAC